MTTVKIQDILFELFTDPAQTPQVVKQNEPAGLLDTPTEEMDSDFVDVEEISDIIESDSDKIRDTLEGNLGPEQDTDDPNPVEPETDTTSSFSSSIEETDLEEAAVSAKQEVLNMVAKTNGVIVFGGNKAKPGVSGYRLKLKNPKDDIAAAIKKCLRGKKVKTIQPGKKGALSGKYTTYVVKTAAGPINIVFAAGKNEGQKFEAMLKNSIASRKGTNWTAVVGALNTYYGIKEKNIIKVSSTGGAKHVKRPFATKLVNVGAVLADISIQLAKSVKVGGVLTDVVYLSIKNITGATFANMGYGDAFTLKTIRKKNTVVSTPSTKAPGIDEFLQKLGVSKDRIAVGFTEYMNASITPKNSKIVETPTFDADAVKTLLAAQLGYGYVYVREAKTGLKFIDLSTQVKALDVIGDVTSVTVKYPYYYGPGRTDKSKQCTVNIQTNKGKFVVEIRGTSGKGPIDSLQCNIRIK